MINLKNILCLLLSLVFSSFTYNAPLHDEHAKFKVLGVCEMCKERIETAVKKSQFVKAATWNVKTKIMEVSFDPHMTDAMEIQKMIAASGHDTEKIKADDKAYNALPSCCHYKREK